MMLSKNVVLTGNYKGVYVCTVIKSSKNAVHGGKKFFAKKNYNNKIWYSKYFDSEIEAAKAYDLKLIELGFEPVNILKRK